MELYFSTDVETDGPIPGPNSMLSLASVALLPDKTIVGKFTVNLETLPGAQGDPDTMSWWQDKNLEAYKKTRESPKSPEVAMQEYVRWVSKTCSNTYKPVFVAYPAGFDFTWCYWYIRKFTRENPFSFSAVDIKSFAMALLKADYRNSTKKNMPKRWFEDFPHTHVALDDALEQGMLFISMLNESRNRT